MTIRIVKEPEGAGPPYERCCFCWRPTTYWHAKKDVAVCPECASTHATPDIPKKQDWCKQTAGLDQMTDPTPTRDEAVPFPAYGELPFAELGSAVKAAQYGAPEPYPFDPEFFPGHQVFGPINFNSLNRIVTWFVKRALASAPAPASGGVDAGAREGAIGWNSPEEWEIEQRAFHAAGRADVPKDVQELVAILWKQYCIAAEPASLSPAATPVSEAEPVAFPADGELLNMEDGERANAFWRWSKAAGLPLHMAESGLNRFHADDRAEWAWQAWCAALAKPASSPAPVRPIGNQGISDYQREIARNMAEGFAAWNAARQEALPSDEPASSPAGGDVEAARIIYEAYQSYRELPPAVKDVAGRGGFFSALRLLMDPDADLRQPYNPLSQPTSAGRVGE